MKPQYAVFTVPLVPSSSEQEELNRFIRGKRVIEVTKQLVQAQAAMVWVFLVEYFDDSAPETAPRNAIDYKEVLSAEVFSLYSKLRELRKKLAKENGLPVYAVFTNEQLAAIATARPASLSALREIEGVGESKAGKFGQVFLDALAGESGAADRPAL